MALERAVGLQPDDAPTREALGYAYMMAGRYEEAAGSYRMAVKNGSQSAHTHYWLGACHHHLGRTADALSEYELARAGGVDDLALLRALGGLYDHANRLAEAAQAYEQLLGKLPADPDVRYTVGVCYHRLGQRDRAHAQYRHLRPISATKAEALYRIMLG